MPSPARPASRRERPAKPALTRAGIVAAAVAILRTEGLERVTMRRLAKELDTGPMSLYVYVRDTDELHAAVLDELLVEVDLEPVRSVGNWRDRLWAVLSSYIQLLYTHPSLARIALVTRPHGPRYLGLVEAVLALLTEGGTDPHRAAWAVDLLLQYATTTATEHGTRRATPAAEDDHSALVAALRATSAEKHPHIAAAREHLVSGHGSRWRWGYDVLLNGTFTTAPPDEQTAAAPRQGTQPAADTSTNHPTQTHREV